MDERTYEERMAECLAVALLHIDGLATQLSRIAALVEEESEARTEENRGDLHSPPAWVNGSGSDKRERR